MSKRRTHSPEFKARVAMEAITGRKTIQEIAADHAVHPIQVSQWKRQLLDGASELLTRGRKSQDKQDWQAKEAEIFQQIGRLQIELEWLKKISAALTPMSCESWSITTTLRSVTAVSVPCWAWSCLNLVPATQQSGPHVLRVWHQALRLPAGALKVLCA
jgi:transposase